MIKICKLLEKKLEVFHDQLWKIGQNSHKYFPLLWMSIDAAMEHVGTCNRRLFEYAIKESVLLPEGSFES